MSCDKMSWEMIASLQILYVALEYWLGKTDKTKAGSLSELILNAIKIIKERK